MLIKLDNSAKAREKAQVLQDRAVQTLDHAYRFPQAKYIYPEQNIRTLVEVQNYQPERVAEKDPPMIPSS